VAAAQQLRSRAGRPEFCLPAWRIAACTTCPEPLPPLRNAARKSSVEYKSVEKVAEGFQVKATTSMSFFGLADVGAFGEVKSMWNQGTGEAQGDATAYSASASGTVTVKPAADGGVGNCSIIEVSEGAHAIIS